jgi:hypothetical protein
VFSFVVVILGAIAVVEVLENEEVEEVEADACGCFISLIVFFAFAFGESFSLTSSAATCASDDFLCISVVSDVRKQLLHI